MYRLVFRIIPLIKSEFIVEKYIIFLWLNIYVR